MSMPMMARAAARASSGVWASLMPPALPRPPTGTWALTATGPISRAAWAASSGVLATFPGGMAMPKEARTSLAWYSSSFMRGAKCYGVRSIRCATGLRAGLRPLDQPVEEGVEVVRDLVAHHRVEQPAHRADDLHRLADAGFAPGRLHPARELKPGERDDTPLQRERASGLRLEPVLLGPASTGHKAMRLVTGADWTLGDALAGAPAAFDVLLAPLLDPAYRLATVLLGDHVEAEDAVQEAALKAWSRL